MFLMDWKDVQILSDVVEGLYKIEPFFSQLVIFTFLFDSDLHKFPFNGGPEAALCLDP